MKAVFRAMVLLLALAALLVMPAGVLAQEATEAPASDGGAPVDDGAGEVPGTGQIVTDIGTLVSVVLGAFLIGAGTVGGLAAYFVRQLKQNEVLRLALERTYMSLPLTSDARQAVRDIILGIREGATLADELTDGVLPTVTAQTRASPVVREAAG